MNALLLYSSVILAALDTSDSHHGSCHELLFGGTYDINSIDLVRFEVANVVTSSWGRSEHEISVYDAAYVAAAQAGGRTLVICDERDLISKGLAVSPSAVLTTGWS